MPKERVRPKAPKAPKGPKGGSNAADVGFFGPNTASDILGVVLAVVAVAMTVAVLSPSSAPVAAACATGLRACFGVGALLVPLAVLLLAVTFFVPSDAPLSARASVGLAVVVTAILAMISICAPEAAGDPDAVLRESVASARGGWFGGAVAWCLLATVGREVGLVVLVGTVVLGLVLCGLSISNLAVRLRQARNSAGQLLRERRERERGDTLRRGEDGGLGRTRTKVLDGESGVETSFIGARRTSVLRRRREPLPAPVQVAPDEPVAATAAIPQAPAGLRPLRRTPNPVSPTMPPAVPVAPTMPAATPAAPTMPWATPAVAAFDGTAALELTEETLVDPPEVADPVDIPDFLIHFGEEDVPVRRRKTKGRTVVAEETEPRRAAAPRTRPAAVSHPRADASRPDLPPLSMLSANPDSARASAGEEELLATSERLQAALEEFGLRSRVVGWVSGPLVTTFKIEMGEGERVSRIRNLEDDIALTLAAESVRIFAPIPGTSLVGIEIPNRTRQNVHLGDVLPHAEGGPLQLAIGRDSEGKPVVEDLARMPHLLIAGSTGSGKSVMINSIIMSLLMRSTPEELRLILIDPKRVELGGYNGLPHLYVPVVTEPKKASGALAWAVGEMDRRLKLFERAGARDIGVYNEKARRAREAGEEDAPQPVPYLVIIVDELSDLMMVAGKDVEASIVRIAQLARAAGIHLIVATQRPTSNVVTGLIKSNIETRIAFSVASALDSRVILDQNGAERLLGRGDMLLRCIGKRARRVLGAYVSDEEIASVTDYIRERGETDYHEEVLSTPTATAEGGGASVEEDEDDPLVWDAARLVVETQLGSTSGLQRRLKVGYARAGRIMDMLEAKGVVGPASGSKPRDVLLDEASLEDLIAAEGKYSEV